MPAPLTVLLEAGVKISMDGKGRWMDNVFIERLWRSLKVACVYLHAFETGSEARAGIGRWMTYYPAFPIWLRKMRDSAEGTVTRVENGAVWSRGAGRKGQLDAD